MDLGFKSSEKDPKDQKKNQEKKEKLLSHQTFNKELKPSPKAPVAKIPGYGKKCLIPDCGISIATGYKYILQCPVMKKMPPRELWAWFGKNKCKCHICFAMNHTSKDCLVKSKKPYQNTLNGKTCGKLHNIFICAGLNDQPKYQSLNDKAAPSTPKSD